MASALFDLAIKTDDEAFQVLAEETSYGKNILELAIMNAELVELIEKLYYGPCYMLKIKNNRGYDAF